MILLLMFAVRKGGLGENKAVLKPREEGDTAGGERSSRPGVEGAAVRDVVVPAAVTRLKFHFRIVAVLTRRSSGLLLRVSPPLQEYPESYQSRSSDRGTGAVVEDTGAKVAGVSDGAGSTSFLATQVGHVRDRTPWKFQWQIAG
eukprot:g16736.t1